MSKIRENFNLVGDVILSYSPKSSVNIVIPERFINRLTNKIDIDSYIKWLVYDECYMNIEYEINR